MVGGGGGGGGAAGAGYKCQLSVLKSFGHLSVLS